MLNKLKGSVSIEATVALVVLFPAFLAIIVGPFMYFTAQSTNMSINSEAGRYISSSGCNIEHIESMTSNIKFDGYGIEAIVGENEYTVRENAEDLRKIRIACTEDSSSGDRFEIRTQNDFIKISDFSVPTTKTTIYIQEKD